MCKDRWNYCKIKPLDVRNDYRNTKIKPLEDWYTNLKQDWNNGINHMLISDIEPSSVILCQTMNWRRLKCYTTTSSHKALCRLPTTFNRRRCCSRTWLHVPYETSRRQQWRQVIGLGFCHRSDGRHGFEKNISSCTVSYTALPLKTDLHFQPTLLDLQNFQQTSIQLVFVSPQIVQNVVTLTHFFFKMCHTLETRLNTQIPIHMFSVDLYKGQVSLASR